MPKRPDISDRLIHFCKAPTYEDALGVLLRIVCGARLIAGNGMIRGGYQCVCFTEAPLPAVATDLMDAGSFTRYSPFGLMFAKNWIYDRGGRPVIYQSDAEFQLLPEDLRWRHVRYEPAATPPIDFTWEREWRVRCDQLVFSPEEAALVVPSEEWEAMVFDIWDSQQDLETEAYELLLDELVLDREQEPCPWRIVRLA